MKIPDELEPFEIFLIIITTAAVVVAIFYRG